MDQTIVNWMLAGFGGLIGFLLNAVWQAVKDLRKADKELTAKVADLAASSGSAISFLNITKKVDA